MITVEAEQLLVYVGDEEVLPSVIYNPRYPHPSPNEDYPPHCRRPLKEALLFKLSAAFIEKRKFATVSLATNMPSPVIVNTVATAPMICMEKFATPIPG